jgi:acetoacetyl-CoA synthetase
MDGIGCRLENRTMNHECQDKLDILQFMAAVKSKGFGEYTDFESLYQWSITKPQDFWREWLAFSGIKYSGDATRIYDPSTGPTPLAKRWFPDIKLNFAENLLSKSGLEPAVISWSGAQLRRELTWDELRTTVGSLQGVIESLGCSAGDRAFAYLPHIPEAITCMAACAASGIAWSSCGTDYQKTGLVSRAKRVQSKLLFAVSSYLWRGKKISTENVVCDILRNAPSISAVILIDYLEPDGPVPTVLKAFEVPILSYQQALKAASRALGFTQVSFSHPLYIMFSSGTTGEPKGIVHSAGGTLLEHVKEHRLHCDIRTDDRLMYLTSTSWMMWNWQVSALASKATVILYDGDPLEEEGELVWRIAESESCSHFGTSAAFLGALERRRIMSKTKFPLANLRSILATGSTLYPSQFDYIQRDIKDLWIQSISGGTDIIGCFALGCPIKEVTRGTLQAKSLGYDVKVFNQDGEPVVGEEGELVCVAPAPSMPIGFIADPEGEQYRKAYFQDFPNVWRHGDIVKELASGELVFSGRSDATLKPGGVRIATADIYTHLLALPCVESAMAVGYTPNEQQGEVIILFVMPPVGVSLTEEDQKAIRDRLKQVNVYYSPALIFEARELPRTTNGKLAELSVKRILAGADPGNRAALINPESLDFFQQYVVPRLKEHWS